MITNDSTDNNLTKVSGNVAKLEYIGVAFEDVAPSELRDARKWSDSLETVIQQLPLQLEVLKPIINLLIATLNPAKIYMSQRNSQKSDLANPHYDLLIVLPSASPAFEEWEPIINLAYLTNKNISISLYNEGNVLEKLKSGHPFYTLHFIPENIVYDNNEKVYPVATSDLATGIKREVYRIFIKLFEKAKLFYRCAEKALHDLERAITLFMLHQATELTYRSIILSVIGKDKRTHDIKSLRDYICHYLPEMARFFKEDTIEGKKELALLNKSYSDARYNHDFEIDDEIMFSLFGKIKIFQNEVNQIMNRITGAVD